MSRLPPQRREDLSGEQQEANDLFAELAHKAHGPSGQQYVYEQANGALMGPFPFFIYHPELGKQLYELQLACGRLPLPADVREVAILTAASQFGDTFASYAHEGLAIHTCKFSEDQAQSLRRGQKPNGLTKECSIAYDVAKSLSGSRGPLPGNLWDEAVEVLGKDSTVTLIQYIAFYSYVAIVLNGVNAGIPK